MGYLLSLFALALPAFAQELAPCSVQGTVTDSVTGQKLRKAFLRINGTGGAFTAVTDDRGVFSIANIPAGLYDVEAERQGYVNARSSGTGAISLSSAFEPLVQLRLVPGQLLNDLSIPLPPQAVLTGSVIDEEGDPWTHARVSLYRSVWSRAGRKLELAEDVEVNDLGEYRLAGLPPGTYFVAAKPDAQWESRHRPNNPAQPGSSQPTWYPSSPNRAGSTPLVLSSGSQIGGITIRLHRTQAHRIHGELTGAELRPGQQAIVAVSASDPALTQAGVVHPDSTFELPELTPGVYELRVLTGLPPIRAGTAQVTVEDRDLDGVSIPLSAPQAVKGQIRIEGTDSPMPGGRFIGLTPVNAPGEAFLTARTKDDGTFEIPEAAAQRYEIEVPGTGFYLKELAYEGQVSHDGTILLDGSGELTITLSFKPARVIGTVTQAVNLKQNPTVVMVPKQFAHSRVAQFDQNGAFTFDDVAPGAYTLYAFESIPSGAWDDPALERELDGQGVEFETKEDELRGLDVPLLSASDLEPILQKLGIQ